MDSAHVLRSAACPARRGPVEDRRGPLPTLSASSRFEEEKERSFPVGRLLDLPSGHCPNVATDHRVRADIGSWWGGEGPVPASQPE
jgi:hypothetical protein